MFPNWIITRIRYVKLYLCDHRLCQECGAQLLQGPLRQELDLPGWILRLRLQLHLPLGLQEKLIHEVTFRSFAFIQGLLLDVCRIDSTIHIHSTHIVQLTYD